MQCIFCKPPVQLKDKHFHVHQPAIWFDFCKGLTLPELQVQVQTVLNRKSSQRHDCGLVWTSHPLGASVLTPVLHKKGIYKDEWLPLWGHPSTLFKTRLCMFSQEWNRGRCSLLLVCRQDCLSKYFNCLSVYWNCTFWYILAAAATTESSHSDILPLIKLSIIRRLYPILMLVLQIYIVVTSVFIVPLLCFVAPACNEGESHQTFRPKQTAHPPSPPCDVTVHAVSCFVVTDCAHTVCAMQRFKLANETRRILLSARKE